MISLREGSKCAQIVKVFEDAYKSQPSIIILDDIERYQSRNYTCLWRWLHKDLMEKVQKLFVLEKRKSTSTIFVIYCKIFLLIVINFFPYKSAIDYGHILFLFFLSAHSLLFSFFRSLHIFSSPFYYC